ncbi:MAG: RNA ligase, partial [Myxococcota bacterium]
MMNTTVLQAMIAKQYIKVQKHPDKALYIYNYTPKAQYDRVWNEWTLACRGLIMEETGKVVARPFEKFFNLGEMESQVIPDEPFEVYEKMDGSLGILYWSEGMPYMASRGSFDSDQALKANEMLQRQYKAALGKLNPAHTYLFEIIYPENRIVVDYGTTEALVLLGIVETSTGKELPLEDIGFPLVQRYDGLKDLEQLT